MCSESYGPIPGSNVFLYRDPDEGGSGHIITVMDGHEVVAKFPLFDERDARIISRMLLSPFGNNNPFEGLKETGQ